MRGRKVDETKKAKINSIFNVSRNRTQFEDEAQLQVGISKATATVYWYNLCKSNKRKCTEKRGRKPLPKVGLSESELTTVRKYVSTQITAAQKSKKSTVALRHIAELLGN